VKQPDVFKLLREFRQFSARSRAIKM